MNSLESLMKDGFAALERAAWREAAELWGTLRDQFPEEVTGYSHGGWALREAGRFDEADRVLTLGVGKFPNDPWTAIHHAWAARDQERWDEVIGRWTTFRANFPDWALGFIEGAGALHQVGRLKEADRLLGEAVDRFPEELAAHREFARMAAHQADWTTSVKRWAALRERFPDDAHSDLEIRVAQYEARLLGFNHGEDRGSQEAQNAAAPIDLDGAAQRSTDTDASRIMDAFESVGDNCEFGFVQRYFGSEPFSLLRWGYVNTDMLVSGLTCEYAGVGEPEYTELSSYPDGEIVIHDSRFFSWVHSGIYESAVDDREKLFMDTCTRLNFLRRKFLRDVRAAEKVYICRRYESIPDEDAVQIYEALNAYGENWLCCVRRPEEGRASGTVVTLRDRLLIGYSELVYAVALEPPPYDSWLSICRTFLHEIEGKKAARNALAAKILQTSIGNGGS